MTQRDVEASNTIVLGNILVNYKHNHALIDPGSTHSFISLAFAKKINMCPERMESELCVAIPTGECLVCNLGYNKCIVCVYETQLYADLVELDLLYFDVILWMDWLASYHASVDSFTKKVTFCILDQHEFTFFLSFLKMTRLLWKRLL